MAIIALGLADIGELFLSLFLTLDLFLVDQKHQVSLKSTFTRGDGSNNVKHHPRRYQGISSCLPALDHC
jgi:hypothetical protein